MYLSSGHILIQKYSHLCSKWVWNSFKHPFNYAKIDIYVEILLWFLCQMSVPANICDDEQSPPPPQKKPSEAICLISDRSKHADGGQMAGSRTVAVERKTLTAINTTVDAMGTNWIIFCSVSREGRGCMFCSQEQLWGFCSDRTSLLSPVKF